jgi:hypothetical protein
MADKKITSVTSVDFGKKTSAIGIPEAKGTDNICYLGGVPYPDGSVVCMNHVKLMCTAGTWTPEGSC